jgi:hypothetical protein
MDSTFDSLAAAAEAKCRNHFINDLLVRCATRLSTP